MRVLRNVHLAVLFGLCAATPAQVLAETEILNGESYNKQDVDSCREEAGYSGMEGDDLVDFVQTCLEDFQGMADYENMGEEKILKKE